MPPYKRAKGNFRLREPKISNWYKDSNCESLYWSASDQNICRRVFVSLFDVFQKRPTTHCPRLEWREKAPRESERDLSARARGFRLPILARMCRARARRYFSHLLTLSVTHTLLTLSVTHTFSLTRPPAHPPTHPPTLFVSLSLSREREREREREFKQGD